MHLRPETLDTEKALDGNAKGKRNGVLYLDSKTILYLQVKQEAAQQGKAGGPAFTPNGVYVLFCKLLLPEYEDGSFQIPR